MVNIINKNLLVNNFYFIFKKKKDNIENWSIDQVKRWISYTCHSHSLPAPYPVNLKKY